MLVRATSSGRGGLQKNTKRWHKATDIEIIELLFDKAVLLNDIDENNITGMCSGLHL